MSTLLERAIDRLSHLPEDKQNPVAERVHAFLDEIDSGYSEKEGKSKRSSDSPWRKLNFAELAVDAGPEDLSVNHDHYLYGTPKRQP